MKRSLNDRRLNNKRKFQNKQAPLAVVIYNDTVHTQRTAADSTGNQTQMLSHVAFQTTVVKPKSVISQTYSYSESKMIMAKSKRSYL